MRTRAGMATLMMLLIAASCSRDNIAGRYVSDRDRTPKDYFELAADGAFTLEEDGGSLEGTYRLSGTQLTLTMSSGQALAGKFEGGVFSDPLGARWTKQ